MADTACWVLTNETGADFDQDGVPHFPDEKHATEEAARIEGDEVFKPRQLGHLCITLACSCCEYVYDEDEDGVCHFDDLAKARKLLEGFWGFTDGQAKCDACKTGPCDPECGDHG